jgi:hypothetical protein
VKRDPWLPLAAGMILGMVLPGFPQVRTTVLPTPQADGSTQTVALADDHAALLAMRALLRGETAGATRTVTTAGEHVVAPSPVATSSTSAQLVSATPATPSTGLSTAGATPLPASPGIAEPIPGAVTAPPSPARRSRRAAKSPMVPAVIQPLDARDLEVRSVLQAYERAWTRMDVAATRSLWPSADAGYVQAAFEPLKEQRLELAACDVGLSGDRALAVCLGTRRFRPRAAGSNAQVERGRWEFELERSGSGWQISTVEHP